MAGSASDVVVVVATDLSDAAENSTAADSSTVTPPSGVKEVGPPSGVKDAAMEQRSATPSVPRDDAQGLAAQLAAELARASPEKLSAMLAMMRGTSEPRTPVRPLVPCLPPPVFVPTVQVARAKPVIRNETPKVHSLTEHAERVLIGEVEEKVAGNQDGYVPPTTMKAIALVESLVGTPEKPTLSLEFREALVDPLVNGDHLYRDALRQIEREPLSADMWKRILRDNDLSKLPLADSTMRLTIWRVVSAVAVAIVLIKMQVHGEYGRKPSGSTVEMLRRQLTDPSIRTKSAGYEVLGQMIDKAEGPVRKERTQEREKMLPLKRPRDPAHAVCFNCGEKGHLLATCPKPRVDKATARKKREEHFKTLPQK